MTDFMMIGKMANQVVGAYADYSTSKIQHEMNVAAREHKKVMTAISNAQQQNSLTHAEVQTRDAGIRAAQSLQLTALKTKSDAEVSAAAAGVSGNSVEGTLQNMKRSALNANAARKATLKSKFEAIGQERKNVKMAAIYSRDIRAIIPPSPTSALLGLSASLLQTWDENQPEGLKSADRLAAASDNLFKRKS